MVLVEPTQKKVATMASPTWGLRGSNPLPTWLPPLLQGIASPNTPFCWSRVMPAPAVVANAGAGMMWTGGLTVSRQPTATAANTTSVAIVLYCNMMPTLEEGGVRVGGARLGPQSGGA